MHVENPNTPRARFHFRPTDLELREMDAVVDILEAHAAAVRWRRYVRNHPAPHDEDAEHGWSLMVYVLVDHDGQRVWSALRDLME